MSLTVPGPIGRTKGIAKVDEGEFREHIGPPDLYSNALKAIHAIAKDIHVDDTVKIGGLYGLRAAIGGLIMLLDPEGEE